MQFVWILTLTCFYIVSLSDKKTLNDDVHINEYFSNEKYTYICNASFIGRRELVRALLLKETTEFIEQELRFHKRFLIEEFDHGSD